MRPSEKGYLVPHAARNIRTRVEAGAVEAFHIRDISAVEGDAEEAGLYVNVRGGGIAGAGKELDLAFETLASLTKTPNGIYYGQLKLDPRWDPLRKDPRFEKLLAKLAPRD
jgi:hypothetical protein